MSYLFFDTETTNFPNERLYARHEDQGCVCQIACILTDDEGNTMSEFSTLIAPDKWVISEGAQAIHGISMEDCKRYGMHSRKALVAFMQISYKARTYVAHNLAFDLRALDVEGRAHGKYLMEESREFYCTMRAATDHCKIPHGDGYKWPKLSEAYEILLGKKLENAHDAMADARACRDVFFEIQRRERETLA